MLKPDSTRNPPVVHPHNSGPEWIEPDCAEPEAGARDAAVFHDPEDLPTDLALDLRLREILEQARLATAASGAMIALARGDQMVCRATLGEKSPGVGVFLNTRSGLSGACVQARQMQQCDDTLTDPRVDAIACRELDIRSILVLPVLEGDKLRGILEVFSSVPSAFNDSDVEALQMLAGSISDTVKQAVESGFPEEAPETFSEGREEDSAQPFAIEDEALLEPDQPGFGPVPRDYRTGVLTAAVIALAVLLGWMVGRVGWTMAVNRAPTQIPLTPEEAQATAQLPVDLPPTAPPTEKPSTSAQPATPRPAPPVALKPASTPTPPAETAEPIGGLVVYEQGKVVFRMPPSEGGRPSANEPGSVEAGSAESNSAEPGTVAADSVQKAAKREADLPAPPSSANGYPLERVEPEYPEEARQQHIEGPVVLKVLVGTGGAVRKLEVISGPPQLGKAAADAVRQWRFQPHRVKGKPVEFEVQITVNFALPPKPS